MRDEPDPVGWSSGDYRQWITTLSEASAPSELNWWLQVRNEPQVHAYDRTLPPATRREWATVFLLLVEGSEKFAGLSRWTAATDAANMRSLLISELGAVPGNETWDPEALARSVLATTTLDPQTAAGLSRDWSTLPSEQILLLRRHKSLFNSLAHVIHLIPDGPDRDRIQVWLDLQPSLP